MGEAYYAPLDTDGWMPVGYISETVTFEYETRGKAMDEEQAVRWAAVQAMTKVSETLPRGGLSTHEVLIRANKVAAWLAVQDDKALAVEALEAAAVSIARSGMSDPDELTAHANVFINYVVEGSR